MLIAPGSTLRDLAFDVADKLGVGLVNTEFKQFPDGETALRILNPDEVDNNHILVIQSMYYPQEKHLLDLLHLSYTLFDFNALRVDAVVPYLCYARSDRRSIEGESVSARTIVKLLEDANIHTLYTIDVHNSKIFEFASTMQTMDIFPAVDYANYLWDNGADPQMVVAPDKGANHRAEKLARVLKVPFTHLKKTRDPLTKKSKTELGGAEITGDEVVVIDDIVSTGKSLLDTAKILQQQGVRKIHVIISHCVGKQAPQTLEKGFNGIIASSISIPCQISKIPLTHSVTSSLRIIE